MNDFQAIGVDEAVIGRSGNIKLHGPEGFAGMRAAGRLAAEILDALVPHVVPGVTTQELDDIVHRMTLDAGAVPATLGYRGFTKSCCTSINHVVCHGIPDERPLIPFVARGRPCRPAGDRPGIEARDVLYHRADDQYR